MKRWRGKAEWVLLAVIIAIAVVGWLLLKDTTIDVLSPKGVIADQQRTLLIVALAMSAVVVLPVFFMLGFFAYKYRDGAKHPAKYQPEWKENSKLEAVWWGIPIVIIGVLAVITWVTSHTLDPYRQIKADHPPVTVQVVALQWKWLFLYPEERIATVNYLTMPKDVPVRFFLTADAPMSAFWIPALGSQIYNMNGMSSQLNLLATHTGVYKGYSTNINGTGYADMKFDVSVIEHDAFHKWVFEQNQKNYASMNMSTFNQLRKPSRSDSRRTYNLTESDLYDQIVGKYMTHHETNAEDTNQSHSHDMEGHH